MIKVLIADDHRARAIGASRTHIVAKVSDGPVGIVTEICCKNGESDNFKVSSEKINYFQF